jgi:hypothetical protein
MGKYYLPFSLIAGSTTPGDLPYIKNRYASGRTLVHICNENACFAPVDSVDKAIELLKIGFQHDRNGTGNGLVFRKFFDILL